MANNPHTHTPSTQVHSQSELGTTGTGLPIGHTELGHDGLPPTRLIDQAFDPITGAPTSIYGVLAEFDNPEDLIAAATAARDAGYKKMDAYSPMPVEGLTEALGWRDKLIPFLMLCGGITGFISAILLQYSGMAWFYPINVGGKPTLGLSSWPQFVVPCFEMTVLFTALTGVVSMIVLNGLPQFYHPVWNAPEFERASSDRFFLCIESLDPNYDRDRTLQFLRSQKALSVNEVER